MWEIWNMKCSWKMNFTKCFIKAALKRNNCKSYSNRNWVKNDPQITKLRKYLRKTIQNVLQIKKIFKKNNSKWYPGPRQSTRLSLPPTSEMEKVLQSVPTASRPSKSSSSAAWRRSSTTTEKASPHIRLCTSFCAWPSRPGADRALFSSGKKITELNFGFRKTRVRGKLLPLL